MTHHASQRHAFFLAPVGRDVGLTSMALGLVQALRRDGVRVGFAKPILQPRDRDGTADLSTHFARTLLLADAPEPIPFAEAEARVRRGEMDALMEDVVSLVETACERCEALVIEGLIPDAEHQVATRLNAAMARSLSAGLIPVMSGAYCRAHGPAEGVELAVRQYGEGSDHPPTLAGVLVNRLTDAAQRAALRQALPGVPLLAAVPFAPELNALRLADLVEVLGLAVEHPGDLARIRVQEIVVSGRGVEGVIDRLKPGALVVTAGERSDIALAVGLAYLQGTPLAGLLLTCGTHLAPQVEGLMRSAMLAGLPILSTPEDTFTTGANLAAVPRHVTTGDPERMEQAIAHVAEHLDTTPLREGLGRPGRPRMPPPAFRHRLVQSARRANKRIVLPEGEEPRTLQAAAICQRKGIARCVLLGDPARIHQAAQAQGVELPPGIEIVDPEAARGRYVAPMMELRRAKGLTAPQAEEQLADTVVLGTMMLALDEVDGLVSGAIHTTANTIRPALQLIRTAPGASIVSSVFFMLMPEEVLVYGDCAVNPDPSAEELADIALQSADSAAAFGIEPRVAMISYSTGESGSGADVEKVRRALAIARAKRPGLLIDGPMQYDAASVESVGQAKAPGSPVAGRASVFVFPDLNTGNTTYKAVQRSAHVVSVGPMLQGLRKPVNDLSRGALVDDIVYTIALTAIQATQAQRGTMRAAAE
ncbi:MAG TPA: phosphate acetyltransferase [Acetobacteraceae bacterium]|nr:phosphate acetyltransferase [Acetobacteraceae bacterium]